MSGRSWPASRPQVADRAPLIWLPGVSERSFRAVAASRLWCTGRGIREVAVGVRPGNERRWQARRHGLRGTSAVRLRRWAMAEVRLNLTTITCARSREVAERRCVAVPSQGSAGQRTLIGRRRAQHRRLRSFWVRWRLRSLPVSSAPRRRSDRSGAAPGYAARATRFRRRRRARSIVGPVPQGRQGDAALSQRRRARVRHAQQPRDRPRQRRDLLQQLRPDGRPGGLRSGRQHDHGRRQRQAVPRARRRHRLGREARHHGRFRRSLRPDAERRRQGRHAHRRPPRDPPRRQRDGVRAGQVHAVQERSGQAAAVVHRRPAHRSTTRTRRRSPIRTRSSSCSACRSSTRPTSSTPTPR